jgi:hypothetical protein
MDNEEKDKLIKEILKKVIKRLRCLNILYYLLSILFLVIGIIFASCLNKLWDSKIDLKYLTITAILLFSFLFSYLCLRIPYDKYKESKIREISKDVIDESLVIRKIKDDIKELKDC